MERLTQKTDYCTAFCRMEDRQECAHWTGCVSMKCGDARQYERLAAYEDTGLEPEEMKRIGHLISDDSCIGMDFLSACIDAARDGISTDRLRELAKAEKDGLLVVLPCKEGTKIYVIRHRLSGKHEIAERYFSLTYNRPEEFGKSVFLTLEDAEDALG